MSFKGKKKMRSVAFVLMAAFCLLLFTLRTKHTPIIKGNLSASDISQIEKVAGKYKRKVVWFVIEDDLTKGNFRKLAYHSKLLGLNLQLIQDIGPEAHMARVTWGPSPSNDLAAALLQRGTNGWEAFLFVDPKYHFVTNN